MEDIPKPTYITLDVELVSSEDLSPIAHHLKGSVFVLGHQQVDGQFYLSFEPTHLPEKENTPENSTKPILELLQEMPSELKNLWARASSKVFDFGFDSGIAPPPYTSQLSSETLKKVAELGANIAITIYQYDSSPPEEAE